MRSADEPEVCQTATKKSERMVQPKSGWSPSLRHPCFPLSLLLSPPVLALGSLLVCVAL